MLESGQLNFIKRPDSDFLEKSELDFGIFFVDIANPRTDSHMLLLC